MPIVAGIAAIGQPDVTLLVRSIALASGRDNQRCHEEIAIALLNGAVWGGIAALFAYTLIAIRPSASSWAS